MDTSVLVQLPTEVECQLVQGIFFFFVVFENFCFVSRTYCSLTSVLPARLRTNDNTGRLWVMGMYFLHLMYGL